VPQYLLTVSRRPRRGEKPTAHLEPYDSHEPFKRGPLSASISGAGDTLIMRYGCVDMADVLRCLADEGSRCGFMPWIVGLLDNVTFAEAVGQG
jgi:hypothetical protein